MWPWGADNPDLSPTYLKGVCVTSCLDLDSILLLVSQPLILYMLLKFLTFFKFLDLGSLRHHLLTKHYSTFSIFFFLSFCQVVVVTVEL